MKILYVASSRLPTEKAHGLQIMKTIEAFIKQGAEVTLLVPERRNPIKDTIQSYYGLKRIPRLVYVPNIFAYLEKPTPFLYFSLLRFVFGAASVWMGLWGNYDVVYSRNIGICFFLAVCGKKVAYEDHEPKKSMFFLYKICVRLIWKKIVVAPGLAELYDTCGVRRESYAIIPNGVDPEVFQTTDSDRSLWQKKLGIVLGEKIILYVGHFYRWKGIYTLIDASLLISSGTIVLLGGAEKDVHDVKKYIEKKNAYRVRVHPFVSHKEAIRFMKSADMLILPNTAEEERSLRYTTPIKLFEYMASGVPLIASNIPSFSWFLKDGDSALFAKPDSPRDFSEKINTLLDNPALGQELARHAAERVSHYSWDIRAQKIINFLHPAV